MKTLLDYILEAREYFNPDVELEDVMLLFTSMAKDDEFDETLLSMMCPAGIDEDTLDAILTAYFFSKSGMGGKVTKEGCQKFLDMVKKQPLERIKRILGAGSEGMIYNIGDGKVLKMIFDTDFLGDRTKQVNAYKSMVGKKFKTLPNVYKATDEYIIRDNVSPSTKKCMQYYSIATTKYPGLEDVGGTMEKGFARGKIYDVNMAVPKTKDVQEVRKWLLALRSELAAIGINIEMNYGDFKPANLGETKDGRVVYFDW